MSVAVLRSTMRRVLPAAVLAGATVMGPLPSLAASPAAAGPVITTAELGDCYLAATRAPASTTLTFTIRRGTAVKPLAKRSVTSDASGDVDVDWGCARAMRPGDRLTLAGGGVSRTWVVPAMRVAADPAADRASGRVPNDKGTLEAFATHCMPGGVCWDSSFFFSPDRTTTGAWSQVVAPGFDIQAGDGIGAYWTTPRGDRWKVTSTAPVMIVRSGASTVTGTATPGKRVQVRLVGAGDVIRAQGTATASASGRWTVTLRKNGTPVPVTTSDVVRSDVFTGATVAPFDTQTAFTATTGQVVTTCEPDARVVATVRKPGANSFGRNGVAGADGDLTLDFSMVGLPATGWTVTIDCRLSDGNILRTVAPAS